MDNCQRAFEMWGADGHYIFKKRENGSYIDDQTAHAFYVWEDAWKAALSYKHTGYWDAEKNAIVDKPPQNRSLHDPCCIHGFYTGNSEQCLQCWKNLGLSTKASEHSDDCRCGQCYVAFKEHLSKTRDTDV